MNRWLGRTFGVVLKRREYLYEWQREETSPVSPAQQVLPHAAEAYLKPANPRLLDLEERYARLDRRVTTAAVWSKDKITDVELRSFRGDNPYVWQRPGLNSNDVSYLLSYYALKAGSTRELLKVLDEDGAFGAKTLEIDGRLISRDLLDSVREIEFLQTHAALGTLSKSILDIGAGYGRLPHRLQQATPDDVKIYATDAFPQSTFLSEYYLRFREANRAQVVALDEVDDFLAATPIDIAVNIHSFSECTLDAIAWWTERLALSGVRHLMVIPNNVARDGTVRCTTNAGEDMEGIFSRFGYQVKVREPRYVEPLVQRYGLDPAQFNLFELA